MEYLGEAGTVGVFAIFAVLLVREVLQHRDRVAWKNGNGGPERRADAAPCPLAQSMAQQITEMHRLHTATDADGDEAPALPADSFTVTVIDDVPIVDDAADPVAGVVEEEHLDNFVAGTGFGSTGNEDDTDVGGLDAFTGKDLGLLVRQELLARQLARPLERRDRAKVPDPGEVWSSSRCSGSVR